ncbi:hypothetical protein [Nannocystis pusilla]
MLSLDFDEGEVAVDGRPTEPVEVGDAGRQIELEPRAGECGA